MKTKNKKTPDLQTLFELANHYPSPHNGQPIVLKQINDTTIDLYFQKERGLQAVDISLLFSYVTMGVFTRHFLLCAQALGHQMTYKLALPKIETIKGTGEVKFARYHLGYNQSAPDEDLRRMILFRQTSRKKYYEGLNDTLSQKTIDAAHKKGMQLVKMSQHDAHQAIWLNQRAVFDDMFDSSVRHELNHWLRYNQAEKEAKMDGLSYDCMELNGSTMKFLVKHYRLLRWPGISSVLKKYYLRTMSDNSDVYYMLAPFSNEQESFNVGLEIMNIWAMIAREGYYLHPFGTIMSNVDAHQDFLKLASITNEDIHKNFLIFIYRAGKSEEPNQSLRIPIEQHLIKRN